MAESRLYDNLLELPLFLGMSRNDLQTVAGKTKFDFRKFSEETVIVSEGEPCKELFFLLKGNVMVQTVSDDHAYRIVEELVAPNIFQAETIFGLRQRYTHTYTAKVGCSIMSIDKQEMTKLSDNFEIFRINLLNLYSTQSQKMQRQLLTVPPKTLEERIVSFFASRCVRQAGKKYFYIKMVRIAEEVNDSRLDVSHALNRLQEQGLLRLFRGLVYIPSLEKLLQRT